MVPIVRYMLLCDDWRLDGPFNRRVTIVGLIWNIRSFADPPFPLFYSELCVFLALTEVRGPRRGRVVCIDGETGATIFETPERPIPMRPDPLEVVGVLFRIRNCTFPRPGRYSVQFWYDGVVVEERPLRTR